MLHLTNRLKNEADIQTLFRKGKGVFDAVCGVKYTKNSKEESRFAIMIGKKVSKKAVVRNKIRRQYRAILRKHLPNIAKGFDVLLIVSPKVKELTYKQKEERLITVLQKGRLL